MTKFRSKYHGMNQAKKVWVCKTCNTFHDKQVLGLKKRPTVCIVCNAPRDFYYFASRAESKRYSELRLQESVGIIDALKTQVPYPVLINGVIITKYIADFVYKKDGQEIVEDVKGNKNVLTDIFILKKKMIEAMYGIEINIIVR